MNSLSILSSTLIGSSLTNKIANGLVTLTDALGGKRLIESLYHLYESNALYNTIHKIIGIVSFPPLEENRKAEITPSTLFLLKYDTNGYYFENEEGDRISLVQEKGIDRFALPGDFLICEKTNQTFGVTKEDKLVLIHEKGKQLFLNTWRNSF